jgi:hypothetical protein
MLESIGIALPESERMVDPPTITVSGETDVKLKLEMKVNR